MEDVEAKIERLSQECEQLKAQMSNETPAFSTLFDEVSAGKMYKMSRLAELVKKQRKLTPTQQAYLFRQYRIDCLTGCDAADSTALAMLMLGNENLSRWMVKRVASEASISRREMVEIELDNVLRRAIDGYDVDCGVNFSTYAYTAFVRALKKMKVQIETISTETKVENKLTINDVIGDNDEFIDEYTQKDYKRYVWGLLGYFNDRAQFITMAYLGKYCEPMTYAEIGAILGVSGSYVSEVMRAVIRNIRKMERTSRVDELRPSLARDKYHLLTCAEFNERLQAEAVRKQ